MDTLREETWWTRGLGRMNPRAWPDDNDARFPPPDYDNHFRTREVFDRGHDNMANFELQPRKPRKRAFLLCCFVIIVIILLIAIIATPTAISLADDGSSDLQTGTGQETVEFFSCFILDRTDTAELNNPDSSTRIQFEQEFCDSIQTAVNPTTELNCEILRFVGATTVVEYKLGFPESQVASTRGKIETAITEAMSLGQLGEVTINNRVNVTELIDGITNDNDCQLLPFPSTSLPESFSTQALPSSSALPILTTALEPESSSSSIEMAPATTVEPEASSFFETIRSSSTIESSSISPLPSIPSTTIEFEFSSSPSMLPSSSSFFEETSSIFLTPSPSKSSAEFKTTLITSFELSSSIDFSTEAKIPSPTTNFPLVPTTSVPSDVSSSPLISPSSVLIVPTCTGHDDGPCDHDHRFDFSHHWQCYIWWILLFETGLWEQDVMYSSSLEPYEYHCLQRLPRIPWIPMGRKRQIRRARNQLSNYLITGKPRFSKPEPQDIPNCAINRILTLQCYIWWAIVSDAHVGTFFEITLSPLEDFEDACFNQTFRRPNEARDIIFAIATGANVSEFISHVPPEQCGCGGLPPRPRLRLLMRCYAWWIHLYQSALWDQDMLSSPFLNKYERKCGRLLVDIPFLRVRQMEEIQAARERFRAEGDGLNITALNMTTPLDGDITVCPTSNSSTASESPEVESRDHLKNCFVWWHFVYEEVWEMKNLSSILSPWEWWCYTRIVDGSFEIEDHHHHIHE